MKQITQWEAFDGEVFKTEAECKRHEREHAGAQLVGLSPEQVMKALFRDESALALADAIEVAAYQIRKARIASGERKRRRNGEAAPQGAPETP